MLRSKIGILAFGVEIWAVFPVVFTISAEFDRASDAQSLVQNFRPRIDNERLDCNERLHCNEKIPL